MATIEADARRLADAAKRPAPLGDRLIRYGRFVVPAIAAAAMVAGLQSVVFYRTFTPRVEDANRLLFDLVVESTGKQLYEGIGAQVRTIEETAANGSSSVRDARRLFHEQFSAAPMEAIGDLQAALETFEPGDAREQAVARLLADLRRLEAMHADRYEPLLDRLAAPPFWLWPTAHLLARYSDVGEVMTLNRALHLAQVGEVGTARVMLAGLRASTESPRMLGVVHYLLARLEFELFRARPDAELYSRSVQYVRQSLHADPDSELAKRFLDYLLSLSQAEAISQTVGGEPTTASEGEGAAVSADERRF